MRDNCKIHILSRLSLELTSSNIGEGYKTRFYFFSSLDKQIINLQQTNMFFSVGKLYQFLTPSKQSLIMSELCITLGLSLAIHSLSF